MNDWRINWGGIAFGTFILFAIVAHVHLALMNLHVWERNDILYDISDCITQKGGGGFCTDNFQYKYEELDNSFIGYYHDNIGCKIHDLCKYYERSKSK